MPSHPIPEKKADPAAKKKYSPMVYVVSAEKNAYLCDANGNETRHLAHRVSGMSYNRLNLPAIVTFTDKNTHHGWKSTAARPVYAVQCVASLLLSRPTQREVLSLEPVCLQCQWLHESGSPGDNN